jgi:hypothetical protein
MKSNQWASRKLWSYSIPDSTATNGEASVIQGVKAEQYHMCELRHENRLVFKDGTCNIVTKNILERKSRYLLDLFTTFIDMKWRYNLLLFGLAYVGSWFAFALVSMLD